MTASVGAVAEIWRFPVKSMAGERVDTADLGPLGVPGDRHYAIRDVVSNKIVSAKQSKVGTALLNCRAWTTKDGVKLRVNGSSFLVDEGAGLDAALSMLLGRAVRLVSATTDREVYESYWPPIEGVALSDVTIDLPIGMQTQAGTFVDLAALHLASTGAVQELQRLCPGSTITMRRFRPSIVIDTGREVGFVENTWAGREAQLGGAVIRFGSASPRCIMTTLEQGDLPRDPKVLQTLAANNRLEFGGVGRFACLGVYAEVVVPGRISVGDTLVFAD